MVICRSRSATPNRDCRVLFSRSFFARGRTPYDATTCLDQLRPAAEDETWDRPATPEWFYVVRFNMAELWYGYTGTADDVIATEIPEHWLHAAK